MTDTPPILQILKRWNTRREVFEDARAANPDLDMIAVHRWFQRGVVPPKYDAALLQGADRRGIGLHYMELARARGAHTDQRGQPICRAQQNTAEKDRSSAPANGGAA